MSVMSYNLYIILTLSYIYYIGTAKLNYKYKKRSTFVLGTIIYIYLYIYIGRNY